MVLESSRAVSIDVAKKVEGKALTVGGEVYMIGHHHTYDAHINNTYFPLVAEILEFGEGDRVKVKTHQNTNGYWVSWDDLYETKEECESELPANHPDN